MCRPTGRQQHDPGAPQQGGLPVQELRIGVDRLGPLEDLEVARHVPQHEAREHDAGDGHDDLLAQRRAPEPEQPGQCRRRERPTGLGNDRAHLIPHAATNGRGPDPSRLAFRHPDDRRGSTLTPEYCHFTRDSTIGPIDRYYGFDSRRLSTQLKRDRVVGTASSALFPGGRPTYCTSPGRRRRWEYRSRLSRSRSRSWSASSERPCSTGRGDRSG